MGNVGAVTAEAVHQASDGLRLHVEIDGPDAAPTVVLAHGLAGSIALSWRALGVIDRLTAAGLRVVAYDARGHGRSDAPHDPARYGDARMARDLVEVVDAFAGETAVVVGYSLGAGSALLALQSGLVVRAAVIGAASPAVIEWTSTDEGMRTAAVGALRGTVEPDPAMAAWVAFFDAIGADRVAVAAVLDAQHPVIEHWDRIITPIVAIAGADDAMAAPPDQIAQRLPNARSVTISGDHLSAPAAPEFAETIVTVTRQ